MSWILAIVVLVGAVICYAAKNFICALMDACTHNDEDEWEDHP